WLIVKNNEETVFSIEAVYEELTNSTDSLSTWAKSNKDNFFLPPNPPMLSVFPQVSQWAMDPNNQYTNGAREEFLDVADYFLVCYALANNMTLVTHERLAANITKRIKIPNVCVDFQIPYMGPFEMLRQEQASFILG
ncbi:MAG: hypothetical protein RLZZ568_1993, partial [Cyanobacteriota bacterium]